MKFCDEEGYEVEDGEDGEYEEPYGVFQGYNYLIVPVDKATNRTITDQSSLKRASPANEVWVGVKQDIMPTKNYIGQYHKIDLELRQIDSPFANVRTSCMSAMVFDRDTTYRVNSGFPFYEIKAQTTALIIGSQDSVDFYLVDRGNVNQVVAWKMPKIV